jgi:hypothetical protein
MKKHLLFIFSFVCFTALSAQNGTCTPPIGNDCVTVPYYIDSASTSAAVSNFTNDGTDCNAQDQNYQDYQNKIASEAPGGSFNLHVGMNHALPGYLSIWVDWNNDLSFGSGEQVFSSVTTVATSNIAVNVPINAVSDTLILRIRCSNSPNVGPCDSIIAGETEDYRLIVLDPTGINTISENPQWMIAPNPAKDFLLIEMENEPAEIFIYDLLGNEILKTVSENGTSEIDISTLPHGAYFVRVNVNGRASVKKFVH